MMVSTSKILIIRVTGSLGFDLAISSLRAFHPTFGLVRDSVFSDPIKFKKLRILSNFGVTLLKGSLQEPSLLEAIKLVDVVICSIPSKQVLNQKLLVQAIKIADCVKVNGVFMKQTDVVAFTIATADDPRTLTKTLYLRSLSSVYCMNELVEIWEDKISKKLQRIYVPEDELLKKIKDRSFL